MYGVSSRHQGTPTGGTDGVDIVILQDDPTVGQRVDVGGRDLVGAVEADIVPSEIVSHYQDDVRRFSVDRIYVVERQNKEKDGKTYFKAPKVQRLITHARLRRKAVYRKQKVEKAKKSEDQFNKYVESLKKARVVRRERSASGTGKPKPTN